MFHKMILVGRDERLRAEEWYCLTCGHHYIVYLEPRYWKEFLSYGDKNAIHTGGRYGQYKPQPEKVHGIITPRFGPKTGDEERLNWWRNALTRIGKGYMLD